MQPQYKFEVDIPTSVIVGSEHTIELLATGDAFLENTEFSQTSEFQAVVDPQVFIDPSFPYADLYTITFNTPYVNQFVAPVPGDFNQDGSVNAADYVVWRKGLGTTYTQNDYNVWRAHFGQTAGSGAGAIANAAVPEPATLVLLIPAVAGWCLRRSRAA